MRKIAVIAWNSLVLTMRDRKALMFAVLMPLVLTAILGLALRNVVGDGHVTPATVLVVNADQPVTVPALPGAATGTGSVDFGKTLTENVLGSADASRILMVRTVTDEQQARADVAAGKAVAVVVVPASFTADALGSHKAEVAIYTDPGDPTRAAIVTQIVRSYTDELTTSLLASRLAPQMTASAIAARPKLTTVASGARPVSAMQYYAVAMALMCMVISAMQWGGKLLAERENGTLQRMFVAPVTRGEVLAGQLAGAALMTLVQFGLLMVGTRIGFGVDWGPWPGAVILGGSFALAAAGIGVLTAALVKDKKAADIASGAAGNVLALLSGGLIPVYSFPAWLKIVARITPNYWALQGFLDQMSGVGAGHLWLPSVVLLAVAVVTGAAGTMRLAVQ